MNHEQIKELLKKILVDRLGIDPADVNATDDAMLFDEDGWGIDSVDSLDLVLGIEKTFGVRITQDENVMKHFKTMNTLAAFIGSELPVQQPQAAE
jgi:acyl carrier protein